MFFSLLLLLQELLALSSFHSAAASSLYPLLRATNYSFFSLIGSLETLTDTGSAVVGSL